jgi:hypothetical protein
MMHRKRRRWRKALRSRHSPALHDPFFAWLHQLSELIVPIDETLDADEPATPADASRLLAQALTLMRRSNRATDFAGNISTHCSAIPMW